MTTYLVQILIERVVEAKNEKEALNEVWFNIHHDSDPSNPPDDAKIAIIVKGA